MLSNGKRRPPSHRRRFGFDRLESRIALSGFYVSPAGDDSAAGTVAAPWRTVPHAVASAAPGDVINLRTGSYDGGIYVTKPDLTIRSFPGERATLTAPLDVNNLWFDATGGKALDLDLRGGFFGVKFERGSGLVDGCKIIGTGYYGIKVVPGADYVTINRTEIAHTASGGIDDVNGDYLTVRDSYIHDTGSDAITVKGGAFGALIERNRIENSSGTGIDGGQWTDDVWFDPIQNPGYFESVEPIIRNNIVIGTDYAGIALHGALRPVVSNNTLIDTARIGQASIYIASFERFSTNVDPIIVNNIVTRTVSGPRPLGFITRDGFAGTLTMSHNRYYNAGSGAAFWSERSGQVFYDTFATWQATLGADANSSLGDPGIDASGRLMADSQSIDAGRTLVGVVDDFDREPRTGAYDIGADEYPAALQAVPPAPGGLVAQGTTSGRIALTWAGSPGADAYLLERSADGLAGWSQVGTAGAGVTAWQDTGLAAATTYHYRVRAANGAGLSPYSATATTTPADGTLFVDHFAAAALGPSWSTVGGTWDQADGVLRQSGLEAADPKSAAVTGIAFPTDVEVTARVRVDSWAGGDSARAGVGLGVDAAGRGYNLVFHQDTNTVQFLHDHVAWGNSYAFAWRVGTWYWFTLRQEGGVLYGKAWADGEAEPEGWMFRQDGWAPRAGAPGLNGGSYAGSTASFDDFSVTT